MRIHRPVSTRQRKKGFEKPAAPVVDPRPHRYITVCGVKLTYEDDSLITPCHRTLNYEEWDNDNAARLIEKYALVATRFNRKWQDVWKNDMLKQVGLFKRLWRSQLGKCAITGTKLLGGPGLIGHGIGIDVIDPDQDIIKGNIRLVSVPMAITRLAYPYRVRTQFPDYSDRIMSMVLTRSLIPLLEESRILRRGPIDIKPSHGDSLVEITMHLLAPEAPTIKGYRNTKSEKATEILKTELKEGHIIYEVYEPAGYSKSRYMSRRRIVDVPDFSFVKRDINLNDPIDPVKPLVSAAEQSLMTYASSRLIAMTADLLDYYC